MINLEKIYKHLDKDSSEEAIIFAQKWRPSVMSNGEIGTPPCVACAAEVIFQCSKIEKKCKKFRNYLN